MYSFNMYTKRIQVLAAGVLSVALLAGLYLYAGNFQASIAPAQETPQGGYVSLTIEGLYENKTVPITQGESALKLLQVLDTQDPSLQLSIKEYAGLGVLVVGMHGITNGTNKEYWQYKVNGTMPQIGADKLILKNGDSVEWFFGASQE